MPNLSKLRHLRLGGKKEETTVDPPISSGAAPRSSDASDGSSRATSRSTLRLSLDLMNLRTPLSRMSDATIDASDLVRVPLSEASVDVPLSESEEARLNAAGDAAVQALQSDPESSLQPPTIIVPETEAEIPALTDALDASSLSSMGTTPAMESPVMADGSPSLPPPPLAVPTLPWHQMRAKPSSPKLTNTDVATPLVDERSVEGASSSSLPSAASVMEVGSERDTVLDDVKPSSSMFHFGKRSLEVMGRLRPIQTAANSRMLTPRSETGRSDHRRRSLFAPLMSRVESRTTIASPTRQWLDWLETPGMTLPRASKLRALRSSSMLSTSSSMQSLRQTTVASPTGTEDNSGLFGMPLHRAVAATRVAAALSPDLVPLDHGSGATEGALRPPLLSRAQAQQQYLPRVVTRCIESLEKWGCEEEGIYRISGRSSHSFKLRALWDVPGTDLNMADIEPADLDVHAVCSVLKMYLRELPDPLLPCELTAAVERVCGPSLSSQSPTPSRADSVMGTTSRSLPMVIDEEKQAEVARELEPLMQRIPYCEWYLLREMAEHLGVLIDAETVAKTKMPLSNLTLVLAPTLQVSGMLFMTLIQQRHVLFTETTRPWLDAAPWEKSGGASPVLDHVEPLPTTYAPAIMSPGRLPQVDVPVEDVSDELHPAELLVASDSHSAGSTSGERLQGSEIRNEAPDTLPIAQRFSQPRSSILAESVHNITQQAS